MRLRFMRTDMTASKTEYTSLWHDKVAALATDDKDASDAFHCLFSVTILHHTWQWLPYEGETVRPAIIKRLIAADQYILIHI